MSDIEEVHNLFRGASEIGKQLRIFSFMIDLIAGGIASYVIFTKGGNLGAWQPLLAFILVASSMGIRALANHVARFAEICRRESIRAFAYDKSIGPARLSMIRSDAPYLAAKLAKRLPTPSILDYYDVTLPPGESRLRELYANSAFHTWRLLRSWGWVIGTVGCMLFLITFSVIYGLATQPLSAEATSLVLSALCSIVLAIISLRSIDAAISATKSALGTRKIADTLILQPLPTGESLNNLTKAYDFERTGTPSIPTWWYKYHRDCLGKEWDIRRKAFATEIIEQD